MRVVIPIKTNDGNVEPQFVNYVCSNIKTLILDINKARLKKFDKLLNLNTYNCIQLLLRRGLLVNKLNGFYEISFDRNIKFGGMSCYDVVKFITYGNIDTHGYNYIEKVFNYIDNNINELYRLWRLD